VVSILLETNEDDKTPVPPTNLASGIVPFAFEVFELDQNCVPPCAPHPSGNHVSKLSSKSIILTCTPRSIICSNVGVFIAFTVRVRGIIVPSGVSAEDSTSNTNWYRFLKLILGICTSLLNISKYGLSVDSVATISRMSNLVVFSKTTINLAFSLGCKRPSPLPS
jgi:hypothetical protein